MTMSTSSAPAATASATSASLTASDARPDGNAVATEATATPLPASAARATRDQVGVDADGGDRRHGRVGRVGPARLGAQPADLARRVGALQRGQVDHADRRVQRPQLGVRLIGPGGQRGRPLPRRRPGRRRAARAAPGAARRPSGHAAGSRPADPPRPARPRPPRPGRPPPCRAASPRSCWSAAHRPTVITPPRHPDHSITRRAGGGKPGLDHRVDDPQPLVEMRERALHRVDREPLDVRPAVAERLGQPRGTPRTG